MISASVKNIYNIFYFPLFISALHCFYFLLSLFCSLKDATEQFYFHNKSSIRYIEVISLYPNFVMRYSNRSILLLRLDMHLELELSFYSEDLIFRK